MALAAVLQQQTGLLTTFGKSEVTLAGRARAETAIAELYKKCQRPEPAVIWCRSLYQFLTLPSLLIGIIHSEIWQRYSSVFALQPDDSAEYHTLIDEAQAEVWTRAGCLFLQGIRRTSRLDQHGTDVEVQTVGQCLGQLKVWAQSGHLERFEDKRDDLYRRLWTRHLCDSDFTLQELRTLTDQLDFELAREGHFLPEEQEQATPFFDQVRTRYDTLTRSLKGLVATMGAEPTAQITKALWLPGNLATIRLCDLWQSNVNPEAFAATSGDRKLWMSLAESVLCFICIDDAAFVCEQPTRLSVDETGRLHSDNGPALQFVDGSQYFIWHGVNVERRIIDSPDSITLLEIESTSNLELRRVLIERYGQARYLLDTGATVVQQDECGMLYRRDMGSDEDLVMVKVVNSTPEFDGTFKEYFLRVPPTTQTARQAVAWTFGLDEPEYVPDKES